MSRALPGGMLNSKEKTEYEDWLEKLHKEIDAIKPAVKSEGLTFVMVSVVPSEDVVSTSELMILSKVKPA